MSKELATRFVEYVKAERDSDGIRGSGDESEAGAMLALELTSLIRLGRAAVQRLVSDLGTGHQG